MGNNEDDEQRIKNMIDKVEQLELASQPTQQDKEKFINRMTKINEKIKTEWEQKKKEIDPCIKATEEAVTEAETAGSEKDKDEALKKAQLHKVQLQLIQQQMQQIKEIKDKGEDIKKQLEEPTCNQTIFATLQKEAKEVEQQAQKKEWDEYYMKIACLAALRSKNPSTPVGACIVNRKTYQIVGIGHSSMPYVEGRDNDKIFPWKGASSPKTNHELKYPYIVHAAVNAIINKTRESIEGCTIYLTHVPDNDCAHAIIKAGITEIIYCMYTRYKKREEKDDITRTKELFRKKSIELRKMDNDDKVAGDLKTRMDNTRKAYENDDGTEKDEKDWPTGPATDFITWETFFMKIALISKERSTHPKYKVGACVVSPYNQVMSVGYNAYPEDMKHSTTETEEKEESAYMSHAEYKAIIGIPPSVRDCTLYVTQYPCNVCAKVIVQAGITKVVYDEDGGWKDERYISSRKILTTCLGPENVENIRKYDKDSFGANPS